MTTSRVPRILRMLGDPEPPTFLELFFDLVFVFTFARLSQQLMERLDWGGAIQTALLLLTTWWIWELTVWVTDLFDPRLPEIQILVILLMFGSLLLAVAIPTAFGEHSMLFVGTYLGVILTRSSFLIIGQRGHPSQARSVRVLFWVGLSAGPWIAGGLVPDNRIRMGLWALAIGLDYLAARIGWPTPGLGRTSLENRIFTGPHVSERHRQIFCIALGESILSMGLALTASGFTIARWVALVAAFLNVVLLFLIYSNQARKLLSPEGLWSNERVGPGIVSAYSHLLLVAGVVMISVSVDAIVHHPFTQASTAMTVVIVGGPALFLFGTFLFEYAVTRRPLYSRLAAIAILAVLGYMLSPLPELAMIIAADLVLAATLVVDTSTRRSPASGQPAAAH
ncbi:low temperature requirement protein A [Micromonospora sp. NPDC049559]|uniref:low temperature requirement protein A n=1 Tax=Micromonospora sp. NPDC049559 TaxID=3155923 RepID=UPI00342368AF